ncbi:uncharacterized protein LOC125072726 [Vanessa atalanta]|uniref:uncharacterized protein LOC125072726 n=1 Tax=Vanessa atalanta TaxID=42275 RepID=UPI001FCD0AB2|nr:uncharacterized protein LOC125072726 [Vanessa atalanta]
MSDQKRERRSRERGRSRHGRHRDKSSSNVRRQMDLILERLNKLEGNNVQQSPTSEAATTRVPSDLGTRTPQVTKNVEGAGAGSSSRTQSVQTHQMMRPFETKLLKLKMFNLIPRQKRGLAEKYRHIQQKRTRTFSCQERPC